MLILRVHFFYTVPEVLLIFYAGIYFFTDYAFYNLCILKSIDLFTTRYTNCT